MFAHGSCICYFSAISKPDEQSIRQRILYHWCRHECPTERRSDLLQYQHHYHQPPLWNVLRILFVLSDRDSHHSARCRIACYPKCYAIISIVWHIYVSLRINEEGICPWDLIECGSISLSSNNGPSERFTSRPLLNSIVSTINDVDGSVHVDMNCGWSVKLTSRTARRGIPSSDSSTSRRAWKRIIALDAFSHVHHLPEENRWIRLFPVSTTYVRLSPSRKIL